MTNKTAQIFLKILILILQMAFTFTLTFVIYMVLAIEQNFVGGFDNIVGLAIFQPIFGAIISGLTILICIVAGLPIRLVKVINGWWSNHFIISACGILLGIILIILSATLFSETVKVTIDGVDQLKDTPNSVLTILGWFMTAFFALHIYPPKFIRNLLDKFISNIFPQTITT